MFIRSCSNFFFILLLKFSNASMTESLFFQIIFTFVLDISSLTDFSLNFAFFDIMNIHIYIFPPVVPQLSIFYKHPCLKQQDLIHLPIYRLKNWIYSDKYFQCFVALILNPFGISSLFIWVENNLTYFKIFTMNFTQVMSKQSRASCIFAFSKGSCFILQQKFPFFPPGGAQSSLCC